MVILVHEGWQFTVEVDDHNVKSDLIGFSIDGEHKGNVREKTDHYRIGLGKTARRFPLDTPIDDVIREAAVLHLNTVDGKKWALKKRRDGA